MTGRALLGFALSLTACAHSSAGDQQQPSLAATEARQLITLERGTATELKDRLEEEWQFVQALENAGLLHLAFIYAAPLVKAPAHPHHREAFESLLRLQEVRDDDFLVPAVLNRYPAPADLSAPAVVHFAYLRARIALRKGEPEAALALLTQVPEGNEYFARAQCLSALALMNPALQAGPRPEEALDLLSRLVPKLDATRDAAVQRTALLALGRISYGLGRWTDAVRWYDAAARLESARAEALFEQAFAFLRQEDWAHALAAIRSPEVVSSGNPEVPIVEAMALHFSGDDSAAEQVLARALRAAPVPECDAMQGPRFVKLRKFIASWEREQSIVANTAAWSGTATATTFAEYLHKNFDVLGKLSDDVCRKASAQAQREQALQASSAELVGLDVALARRDLDLAIERAERVLSKLPVSGVPTSDMLFRLAALRQARAEVLSGPEADEERTQVSRLIARILEGDQAWERLEEARRFLDAR